MVTKLRLHQELFLFSSILLEM